ncbi:Peptidase inhibitor I9 [Asanoa hainanensis]|uniref:Peptidase inhibitor I9 n=1 Tax=Asanoa hainanensis TaxID=560556 RepID=A0A239P9N8_9ACTN|nr:protease inhibitor I9 family protein [Asanoa hainanensis]SNT63434.1 Peptidase inhibitor I9 [Asanoa hainanensis]
MDWSDSTVYVPYLAVIELADGEERTHPAHFVTLTPDFVFVRDPAGRFEHHPTREVRSIRITVRDLPHDYDLLRADYPHAYEPWHPFLVTDLRDVHDSSQSLAAIVRKLGRPPAHLVAKAPEFGYDLTGVANTADDEPGSLAARFDERATSHDYLVFRKPGSADPYQILSRQRIGPDEVYRIGSWGFAATLTGQQVRPLPKDPDVETVERDDDRLAPHFRVPPEHRVEGEYLVGVRPSGDPLTVATRAGVSPRHVFGFINTFGAAMTDAQVYALRADPDVVNIEDNGVYTVDD